MYYKEVRNSVWKESSKQVHWIIWIQWGCRCSHLSSVVSYMHRGIETITYVVCVVNTLLKA